MALSYSSVKKAYQVFHEIKETVLPELEINSFPEDMQDWTKKQLENPDENTVYGWDKKADGGWENLVFFVSKPSAELREKFAELKSKISNTSTAGAYSKNKSLWMFGWF